MSNSIYTIFPYKEKGVWMFDDEWKGINREPFVAGADTLLDEVCDGKEDIVAIFSQTPFKDFDFYINKVKEDEYGTTYFCEKFDHELWLCPALWVYLIPSPEKIYIKIKT